MLERGECAATAANQTKQTRYPSMCPRCGGSGVQRRGESTYQRCDCTAGRTLTPQVPPQAVVDDAGSVDVATT